MNKSSFRKNIHELIPIANSCIGEEEARAVYNVVKSGWISMGKKVEEFEGRISEYLRAKYSIMFNNGTSSLHAGLMALGVKEGDEVIVPTLSYASSANVILYCGAKPKFCEADPRTFNVTAEELERRITRRTKAVITVDLKGMPCDFDAIQEVADKHSLPILSDSAESFGSIYKNRYVGTQCKVHSFSFFANKNITMGEGGLITTNSKKIADVCRIIRNQGQIERYKHVLIGNNYRPTDISAAFGMAQLKRTEGILKEKHEIAAYYNEAFTKNALISVPYIPPYVTRHSWYMYCLKLDISVNRDLVVKKIRKKGIDSRLSFPPIHLQPIYREKFCYKTGDFPISERIYKTFIDIPCWAGMDKARMNRVISCVNDAIRTSRR